MGFLKKLFSGKKQETPDSSQQKVEATSQTGAKSETTANKYDLKWISPEENPWAREILDLRPISQTMLSTSQDPKMATNAISYGQEDGTSFKDFEPNLDKKTQCDITIPTDERLQEGVLFNPSTMEHKWAIYFMNDRLIFIRSWMREAFVVAKTQQEENQIRITEITGEFTENESKEMTESILTFLLFSHSMNQMIPAPIPLELKKDTDKAGLWAFSTYGNMAHLGYFGDDLKYETDQQLRTQSLLHIAIARGDFEIIERELSKNVNINALAGDGLSTLHWAVNFDVLAYLLEKGANPNVRSSEGATPIMNAVQSKSMDRIELLLKNDADINATDNRGFTALHRAAEMGLAEIVFLLLANGAEKNVSAENHTPLSLAIAMKHENIVKILR